MNKIGLKLTASYILVIVVATLVLGLLFAGTARRFLFAEKQRELVRKGKQLGQTVIGFFTGEISAATGEKILEVTGQHLEAKILVLDRQGRRLAMTPGLGLRGALLSRVDFARVIKGETVVRRGYNPILGVNAIFVGTPVQTKGGQIVGAVFLIAPLTAMSGLISGLWRLGAFAALIGFAFALLLALYLSRTISAPILRLQAAAAAMAKGNFNVRVPFGSDEIGALAAAFNRMADELGKSMAALNREKHKVERILADLAEGVLAVEPNGTLMFINNKARELFGEPAALSFEAFPAIQDLIGKVVETHRPERTELNLREDTAILAHTSPLLDGEQLWGIIVVFQDITALRQVEKLRKQLNADLAHELRAPLTIIQGQTEALLDGVIEEEAEKQKALRDILGETVRLSEMVRALLEIAHLDRGPQALNKRVFCLKTLVVSLAEKYQAIAKKKKITLTTILPAGDNFLLVEADEARIGQVIRNFLDNALRYTPPGEEVLIRLQAQDDTVQVEVTDRGPGIPEAEQPLIWERFYKVNKARTAGEGGVGLGLAIAKDIIQATGGEIWVKSTEGKGATFGFSLPRLSSPPPPDHCPSPNSG
ncbi:HAMP domain-containing sensor histidine kinase [Capillibacterium thermochitinicola]|nr:ATP-binding protein [Capillibacterium thermochitinicola]